MYSEKCEQSEKTEFSVISIHKRWLSKNCEQCNFGFEQLTNQLNPLEVLKELNIILNHPFLITIVNSLLHTAVSKFKNFDGIEKL